MTHLENIIALQTQDLPALIGILESKYGKKWLEQHFSFVAIISEEPPSFMFQTTAYGHSASFMKVAHSIVRSVAKNEHEKNPKVSEAQAVSHILRSLSQHIHADLAREGVPDSIFNGVMAEQMGIPEKQEEPKKVDGITPPPDSA